MAEKKESKYQRCDECHDCPIGLDKVHCQNCYFWRGLYPHGYCDYLSLKFRVDRQRLAGGKR